MFINRAASRMLGYEVHEVLGRNMHDLTHHSHADGSPYADTDCPIFNAFRRGLPCRLDTEVFWRSDHTAFAVEYSSYPIMEGSAVRGAVITFLDITERKRTAQALRDANDALERRVAERTAELSAALANVRELAAYGERVREEERTRIAREVHDELGSLLVALKMDVAWLDKRLAAREVDEARHAASEDAVEKLAGDITDMAAENPHGKAVSGTLPENAHEKGSFSHATGNAHGKVVFSLSNENADEKGVSTVSPLQGTKTPTDNAAPSFSALRCKCSKMGRTIEAAVDNVGRIITDLRPSILDHQGVWAALEWQAQEMAATSEWQLDWHMAWPAHGPEAPALPEAASIAVFRIFQELLSNVARHAGASRVAVNIGYSEPAPMPATLRIEVADDGCGAPAHALSAETAYGVMGMRERARHVGGSLTIASTPGGGTRCALVLPTVLPAASPSATPSTPIAPSSEAPIAATANVAPPASA
jgi:PAS domain S-box-containing protein